MWQPGKSTILQVLISIQSMIFVQNPIENAPGFSFEKSDNQDYNLITQAQTVRYAMLDCLVREDMQSGIWRDVIKTYFSFHGEAIIAGVKRWASCNDRIRNYGGDWRRQFSPTLMRLKYWREAGRELNNVISQHKTSENS
jgi:hypothetical protein